MKKGHMCQRRPFSCFIIHGHSFLRGTLSHSSGFIAAVSDSQAVNFSSAGRSPFRVKNLSLLVDFFDVHSIAKQTFYFEKLVMKRNNLVMASCKESTFFH